MEKKKVIVKSRPRQEDKWWRPDMSEESGREFREWLIKTGQIVADDGKRSEDGRPFLMASIVADLKKRLIKYGIITPRS